MDISKLRNRKEPLIIGHRGYSEIAPENSMAAFEAAANAKVDMIECDVRLSKDNVFVIQHDAKLDRTTSGGGNISDKNFSELKKFNNGQWFGLKFRNEKIVQLEKLIKWLPINILLNIELKPNVETTIKTTAEEILVDLIIKNNFENRCVVSSFDHKKIKAIKELNKNITTGIIFNPIKNFRHSPSVLCSRFNSEVFICNKHQLQLEVVEDAHKNNFLVFVYGIKSEADITKAISLNVDGIIANDPLFVKQIIQKNKILSQF